MVEMIADSIGPVITVLGFFAGKYFGKAMGRAEVMREINTPTPHVIPIDPDK